MDYQNNSIIEYLYNQLSSPDKKIKKEANEKIEEYLRVKF